MSTPNRPTVDVSAVANWIDYLRTCDQQIKELEDAKAVARRHIEAALGEHEVGLVDGQVAVRWTVVNSTRVDVKKLREQAPDLVEACTVPTVTRRFSVGGDQ